MRVAVHHFVCATVLHFHHVIRREAGHLHHAVHRGGQPLRHETELRTEGDHVGVGIALHRKHQRGGITDRQQHRVTDRTHAHLHMGRKPLGQLSMHRQLQQQGAKEQQQAPVRWCDHAPKVPA